VKVLFDHQIFLMQKYGGISKYFTELIRNFSTDNKVRPVAAVNYANNYYLSCLGGFPRRSFLDNINFRGKSIFLRFLNKRINKRVISDKKYDIFHPTYYDPYFLDYIGDKPFVLTIYDMIYEVFPEDFPDSCAVSFKKRLLAEKSAKIIAISENTKRDIIKFYGIDEKKIDVVYLGGLGPSAMSGGHESTRSGIPERYVLFVGNRKGYKNFYNFAKAFSLMAGKDSSLCLVCAGGGGFGRHEKSLFKELSLETRVFQVQADDMTLRFLYKNARVFVFPSLYEGFGIPILEAFASGCPVAVSNTSCFPEIARDAAEYFDPLSVESIKNAIEGLSQNEDKRRKLTERGSDRAKEFSWKETAERTKRVYQSVI